MRRARVTRLEALVLVILPMLVGFGCSHRGPQVCPDLARNLEDYRIARAKEYVISRVGESFFDKYITFVEAHYQPPIAESMAKLHVSEYRRKSHYLMRFRMRMPEKDYVDGRIEFAVDSDGCVIPDYDIRGLPDCVNFPNECVFDIDEARAVEIAREYGLEEGVRPWEVGFHWYPREYATYVWSVSNTLIIRPDQTMGGRSLTIDANTGEVLMETSWDLIY